MASALNAIGLLMLVALQPGAAQTHDRVIGLLSLPEVFGTGPCDKFSSSSIRLYSAPDAKSMVGSIRVDKYWTFHDVGGCEGLTVNVHKISSGDVSQLPAREFEYENPGAIVLQRRGEWFKVRLSDGVAWLQASAQDKFLTLEALLKDGLTFATEYWDGRLSASPGGATRTATAGAGDVPIVRVRTFRRIKDSDWLEIELLSHSVCDGLDNPIRVIDRGWVPTHASSGEPTVWFFSRGC